MITRIGIADCHGLESYAKEGETSGFPLAIRAMSNRQRHAVLYKAKVTEEVDKHILKTINVDKNYIGALNYLKNHCEDIRLVSKGMGDVQKSWKLIPNPKLDPWR